MFVCKNYVVFIYEVKKMEKKQPIIVPMIALRGLTVFPGMAISFPAGRQKSLDALQAAEENGKEIFLVT